MKYEKEAFEKADEDYTEMVLFTGRITALLNPLTFLIVKLICGFEVHEERGDNFRNDDTDIA